ncbi:MAG: hypothetical protein ACK5X7_16805 [Pseudanabaena sp.]|jgi:hypothetical protein
MSTTIIGVKDAVQAASKYFKELQNIIGLSSFMQNKLTQDLRLEEVELSDDRSQWFVTLGYNTSDDLGIRSSREYKIFTVDAASGEVKSMKIREV